MAGLELFDYPEGNAPLILSERVGDAGPIDIIDFNSEDLSYSVPFTGFGDEDFGAALLGVLSTALDAIAGEGDTNGDSVVPIFQMTTGESNGVDGLIHINSIEDVDVNLAEVGKLGFFVGEAGFATIGGSFKLGAAAVSITERDDGSVVGEGGSDDDQMLGTAQDDDLSGGGGADVLSGGRGDDVMNGGAGNDVMTGDRGADVFVFNAKSGDDTITDFEAGEDLIRITNGANSVDDLQFDVLGNDVQISFAQSQITVEDISLQALRDADNFEF